MSLPRFECSVAARARDEPLFATASLVSRWLLVEVDGAWGRDAIVDSELGPHAPAVWRRAMKARGIRVIAMRRDLDVRSPRTSPGMRLVYVVAPRPGAVEVVARRRVIEDLRHVVHATESIAASGQPDDTWEPDAARYLLVCTNGRHDACCATQGRPLVRHLRTTQYSRSVWECSHIGGDRFAANLVVLPDSLYFGRCGIDDADRLLALLDDGRLDLDTFRGRTTFSFLEQAAEHFARAELGLDAVEAVAGARSLGGDVVEVDVAGGPTVRVEMDRRIVDAPTPLTCKGPDGQTFPSYRLLALRVVEPGR